MAAAVQRDPVELQQGLGPIEGFGHSRSLVQILLTQALHKAHHMAAQARVHARQPRRDDTQFAFGIGIVPPNDRGSAA